jgi:hypothetical protein
MINVDMSDKQDKNEHKVIDLIPVLTQLIKINKNHYEMMDMVLQQVLITAKELQSKK